MRLALPAIVLGVILGALPLQGAEIVQDFEDRLPGRESPHWRHNWGKKGDDLLIISSDTASRGKHCLMLDRVTGTNEAPWSAVTPMPSSHLNGHRIRFAFRYEGIGGATCPSLEFRAGAPVRVLSLNWGNNTLHLRSAAKKVPRAMMSKRLAQLNRSIWYVCELSLPTWQKGKKHAEATVVLWELGKDQNRHIATVALPKLTRPATLLYLQVPQGKRGFRFYLDEFKIEPLEQ